MLSAVAVGRFDNRHSGTVPQSRRRRAVERAAWAESSVGLKIANRRLLDPIAAGGFGQVFAAEHVRTHALSAVKLTAPGSRLAACVLGQEAEVLRQLFHPSIVRIEDYGDLDDGRAFLAMEYAQGVELETWLEDNGPMQPERALGVLMQLASALDYMHARGFVHADLKPSHLMIDEEHDDQLKLLDFGCAFDTSDPMRSHDVGGTPGYMPVEQAMGGHCTAAVDVYAMAAVATEMLTGQLPHPHSTRSVTRAIATEPPALPSKRGLVRPGLDEAFAKALAKNPKDRFGSTREFVAALRRAFANA